MHPLVFPYMLSYNINKIQFYHIPAISSAHPVQPCNLLDYMVAVMEWSLSFSNPEHSPNLQSLVTITDKTFTKYKYDYVSSCFKPFIVHKTNAEQIQNECRVRSMTWLCLLRQTFTLHSLLIPPLFLSWLVRSYLLFWSHPMPCGILVP